MDRDQLEAKYQELNQQVYFKLSAGGGAAFPNEQRAALLERLRELFPQSSVYKVPVAVVDPFAEEAQKTNAITIASSSRLLPRSRAAQIIPTDR